MNDTKYVILILAGIFTLMACSFLFGDFLSKRISETCAGVGVVTALFFLFAFMFAWKR